VQIEAQIQVQKKSGRGSFAASAFLRRTKTLNPHRSHHSIDHQCQNLT
jgi:hypothetical protein